MRSKKVLLDIMYRNKDMESIMNVIESHSRIYSSAEETLYEVVSFMRGIELQDYQRQRIFNMLENRLIEPNTVKPLFNACNKMSKEVNDETTKECLRLFNRSLVITNREDMVRNNCEAIRRKINIGKVLEDFKLDKSDIYYRNAIYEICDRVSNEYSKYDTKELVKICSESIKAITNTMGLKISDKDILQSVVEYFEYSGGDLIDIKEGLYDILLYDLKVVKEVMSTLDTHLGTKMKFGKNSLLPIALREEHLESYDIRAAFKDGDSLALYKYLKDANTDKVFELLNYYRLTYLYGDDDLLENYNFTNVIVDILTDVISNSDTVEMNKYLVAFRRKELSYIESDHISSEKIKGFSNIIDTCIDKLSLALDNMDIVKEYHDDHFTNVGSLIIALEDATSHGVVLNENAVKRLLLNAKEKLRSGVGKMSSTEKQVSRTIDTNIERIEKSLVKAAELDNRDRVIEGKIIPSASKIIKLALVAAGTAKFVHPAIAVIGAISVIAISKKTRDRERQYILDEIGIHLRLAERKIQRAEADGDDVALEAALKIENKLKREKQRIEYRKRIYGK